MQSSVTECMGSERHRRRALPVLIDLRSQYRNRHYCNSVKQGNVTVQLNKASSFSLSETSSAEIWTHMTLSLQLSIMKSHHPFYSIKNQTYQKTLKPDRNHLWKKSNWRLLWFFCLAHIWKHEGGGFYGQPPGSDHNVGFIIGELLCPPSYTVYMHTRYTSQEVNHNPSYTIQPTFGVDLKLRNNEKGPRTKQCIYAQLK